MFLQIGMNCIYFFKIFLNALGNPLLFVRDRVNQVNKLNQIITLVQTEYNFSNTEIEEFKKNWVNEQNR